MRTDQRRDLFSHALRAGTGKRSQGDLAQAQDQLRQREVIEREARDGERRRGGGMGVNDGTDIPPLPIDAEVHGHLGTRPEGAVSQAALKIDPDDFLVPDVPFAAAGGRHQDGVVRLAHAQVSIVRRDQSAAVEPGSDFAKERQHLVGGPQSGPRHRTLLQRSRGGSRPRSRNPRADGSQSVTSPGSRERCAHGRADPSPPARPRLASSPATARSAARP